MSTIDERNTGRAVLACRILLHAQVGWTDLRLALRGACVCRGSEQRQKRPIVPLPTPGPLPRWFPLSL